MKLGVQVAKLISFIVLPLI